MFVAVLLWNVLLMIWGPVRWSKGLSWDEVMLAVGWLL